MIGVTTDSGRLVIKHKGEIAADMPVPPLADDAPNYDRPYSALEKPKELADPEVTYREAEAILRAPGKSEEEMSAIARTLVQDRLSDENLVGAVGLTAQAGEAKIYARSGADGVAFAGL